MRVLEKLKDRFGERRRMLRELRRMYSNNPWDLYEVVLDLYNPFLTYKTHKRLAVKVLLENIHEENARKVLASLVEDETKTFRKGSKKRFINPLDSVKEFLKDLIGREHLSTILSNLSEDSSVRILRGILAVADKRILKLASKLFKEHHVRTLLDRLSSPSPYVRRDVYFILAQILHRNDFAELKRKTIGIFSDDVLRMVVKDINSKEAKQLLATLLDKSYPKSIHTRVAKYLSQKENDILLEDPLESREVIEKIMLNRALQQHHPYIMRKLLEESIDTNIGRETLERLFKILPPKTIDQLLTQTLKEDHLKYPLDRASEYAFLLRHILGSEKLKHLHEPIANKLYSRIMAATLYPNYMSVYSYPIRFPTIDIENLIQITEDLRPASPPNTPALALIHLFSKRKEPLTKENLREILGKHTNDPIIKTLYQLGIARGWYLKQLLNDPESLSIYLIHTTRLKKAGRKTYRKLFELLPLLHVANVLGVDTISLLSENMDKYKNVLEEEILKRMPKWLRSDRILESAHTIPSVLAYHKKHKKDVENLLGYSPEELFRLKFGHYNMDKKLFELANKINSSKIVVAEVAIEDAIRALEEEAKYEGLLEKVGKTEEEQRFIETLRNVYGRILTQKENIRINEDELKILKNTKLANRLGLKETLAKVLSFLEKRDQGIYHLRVAVYPEEHLHAMNVPGSCQRAGGSLSQGAIAVTGGPALVFYAADSKGKVVGRALFTLWEGPLGRTTFIPNHNYGHVNVKGKAIEVLKSAGMRVKSDVKVPKNLRPAKSQYPIKRFWKDEHGKAQFK